MDFTVDEVAGDAAGTLTARGDHMIKVSGPALALQVCWGEVHFTIVDATRRDVVYADVAGFLLPACALSDPAKLLKYMTNRVSIIALDRTRLVLVEIGVDFTRSYKYPEWLREIYQKIQG